MKNIFVDLDETLIHSPLYGDESVEFPMDDVPLSDGEIYKACLRPGAQELLKRLRTLGEVYMITRATQDYAIAMIKAFNLGFPTDRIYARHVVQGGQILNLQKGQNYLIDDLNIRDNHAKIWLFRHLGPVKYIQVRAFYGEKAQAFTPEEIEHIVNTITTE